MILLKDLIQTLTVKDWTGRVEILNEDTYEQGTIYLIKGEVIHAETDYFEGESACHTMLSWKKYNFQFIKEDPLVARSIHCGWAQILLDRDIRSTQQDSGMCVYA